MRRCSYFETCSTYGLNVERVFQEACQKILQNRTIVPVLTPTNSRPTTPTTRLGVASYGYQGTQGGGGGGGGVPSPTNTTNGLSSPASALTINSLSPSHHHLNSTLPHRQHSLSSSSSHHPVNKTNSDLSSLDGSSNSPLAKYSSSSNSQQGLITMLGSDNNNMKFIQHERSASLQPAPQNSSESLQLLSLMPAPKGEKELPTPTSTPTTSRKSRRRSNLFIPSSSKKDEKKNSDLGSGLLGSGRSIPLKQGYLYKRSSKTLNKEWKKKYVTLCDDGRLTYHASLHDYMDNVHGKEISLQYVTVKVPGQKPRGSKSIITNSALTAAKNGANNINNNNNTNSITEGLGVLSLLSKDKRASSEKVTLTAYDSLKEHGGKASSHGSGDESGIHSNSNSQNLGSDSNSKIDAQTPNVKKRHRRMKSSGVKSNDIEGKIK